MHIYKLAIYYGMQLDLIENGPSLISEDVCLKVKIGKIAKGIIHEEIHISPHFVYIVCTIFWVWELYGWGRNVCMMLFGSVHLSVCMCSYKAPKLILDPRGKGVNVKIFKLFFRYIRG